MVSVASSSPRPDLALGPKLSQYHLPAEDWPIKERLYLASCVLKIGDDNWKNVSKMMSHYEPYGDQPARVYTPKNCAQQYNLLLESVNMGGARRRRSDMAGNMEQSSAALIVSRLTFDRNEELTNVEKEDLNRIKILERELEKICANEIPESQLQMMLEQTKAEDSAVGIFDDDPELVELLEQLEEAAALGKDNPPPQEEEEELVEQVELEQPAAPVTAQQSEQSVQRTPSKGQQDSSDDDDMPLAGLKGSQAKSGLVKATSSEQRRTSARSPARSSVCDERSSPRRRDAALRSSEIAKEPSPADRPPIPKLKISQGKALVVPQIDKSVEKETPTSGDSTSSDSARRRRLSPRAKDNQPPTPIVSDKSEESQGTPMRKGRAGRRSLITTVTTPAASSSSLDTPKSHGGRTRRGADSETADLSERGSPAPSATSSSISHTIPEYVGAEEYKLWKKRMLDIWQFVAAHRHANVFRQPVTDRIAPGYSTIVHYPSDLHTIKQQLEQGRIVCAVELRRQLMLMFANAIMFNPRGHAVNINAKEMAEEIKDYLDNSLDPNSAKAGLEAKTRRSHRFSLPTAHADFSDERSPRVNRKRAAESENHSEDGNVEAKRPRH